MIHWRSLVAGLILGLVLVASSGKANYAQARRVVFHVFPRATAPAALRVVGCETGHRYNANAHNPSGATGLFQILQGNSGRVLYYRGQRLRIQGWLLWNPWYNARVALFLSHGGRYWGEWSCQP